MFFSLVLVLCFLALSGLTLLYLEHDHQGIECKTELVWQCCPGGITDQYRACFSND